MDIFQDNYNIVFDRFETDSVNVMKKISSLLKRNKGNFNMWRSLSKGHENCH